MLRRVEIKNFRSCKDVVIEIDGDFLVLVGKNGAGKTNLLCAIDWVSRCATSAVTWNVEDMRGDIPLNANLQFDIADKTYEYEVAVQVMPLVVAGQAAGGRFEVREKLVQHDQSGSSHVVFSRIDDVVELNGRAEPLRIGQQSSTLPTLAQLLPVDDPFVVSTRLVLHALSTVRYYPFEEEPTYAVDDSDYATIDRVVRGDAYLKWLSHYQSTGDAGSSMLLRLLHLAVTKAEEFEILQSIIGQNGLGLVDAISYRAIPIPRGVETETKVAIETYHLLRFQPTNSRKEFVFRYGSLSLGTRRILRILVHLLFDHSSVMLIEQPEDGLHQGMTKKLIGMLKANAPPTQLIISSHSSALLNTLRPEEVRLVTISDGVTSVRSLSAREIEVASNFMNKDGTLSDFLETVQEE